MSNIYLILLITFFSQLIQRTKSEEEEFLFLLRWERDMILRACQRSGYYCALIYAINDIIKQIQEEDITVKNNQCLNLCLQYNNIRARDITCQSLRTVQSLSIYEIELLNCTVLLSGNIGYENKDYKEINFGRFLSELKISSLTFITTDKTERIKFKYENFTVKYNYDKTKVFFNSWTENMNEQMEYILDKVYDEFISKIKEKSEPVLSRENIFIETEKNLAEKFSFLKGPSLFDEIKNVTYISYTKLTHTAKIIIKDKIFFNNFVVNFEYALNNNVTYNMGLFSFRNLCFEADEQKSNIYYYKNIDDIIKQSDFMKLNNSNEIWEVIIDDFKKKFDESKFQDNTNNARAKIFF